MAHYTFLDENNIVTEVITGVDEENLIHGEDPETWYGGVRGQSCKRTSYNTRAGLHYANNEPDGGVAFRKNYAGIGFFYDSDRDAFIPPKPYDSWVLDEPTCTWEAPVPYPSDGISPDGLIGLYEWDEETVSWKLKSTI